MRWHCSAVPPVCCPDLSFWQNGFSSGFSLSIRISFEDLNLQPDLSPSCLFCQKCQEKILQENPAKTVQIVMHENPQHISADPSVSPSQALSVFLSVPLSFLIPFFCQACNMFSSLISSATIGAGITSRMSENFEN